jgi:hypothetical protein
VANRTSREGVTAALGKVFEDMNYNFEVSIFQGMCVTVSN